MPVTFGPDEPDTVAVLIDSVAEAVAAGLIAYHRHAMTAKHMRGLATARSTCSRLMAYYTDGIGHGALPERQLTILWNLGQMASDVLEAVTMQIAQSTTTQVKLRPGRYLVGRTIPVDPPVSREIECNNPAFALAQLEVWEAQMRAAFVAVAERMGRQSKAA